MIRGTPILLLLAACGRDVATLPPPDSVPAQGLRRLTTVEYDATVAAITGVTTISGRGRLPEDFLTPFDNDWAVQEPSRVLVEAVQELAADVAAEVVAPGPLRDALVGPTPPPGEEEAHLRAFAADFGRRALRRPLTGAELDDLVALGMVFASSEQDFWDGVDVVVRALLSDPEFLYRIEDGAKVPGHPDLVRLDDHEIATRMSYLVWGGPPDARLLDLADAGLLSDPELRAAIARDMLEHPLARAQVDRFHGLWLGYDTVPTGIFSEHPQLPGELRHESRMLVERVVFDEDRPWIDLFTLQESWLTPDLYVLYGLPRSETEGWVDVSSVGRAGLLSHGAFLSVAGNVLDTSPTKRGKLVRERLLCADVPPPPPDVGADSPPQTIEGACKVDLYAQHREDPSCAGCHELMDPIGLGLERYDLVGRYREYEYDPNTTDEILWDCPIEGTGEIVGVGTFSGPAELGQLLVDEHLADTCVVDHLYQYANGADVTADDRDVTDALGAEFVDGGFSFRELVVSIVADERFGWRRLPTGTTTQEYP